MVFERNKWSHLRKIFVAATLAFGSCILIACQADENKENTNSAEIDRLKSDYGFSIKEESITIDGLESDYEFLFLADNHVLLYETENIETWGWSTQTRIDAFTNSIGVTSGYVSRCISGMDRVS